MATSIKLLILIVVFVVINLKSSNKKISPDNPPTQLYKAPYVVDFSHPPLSFVSTSTTTISS